MTIMFSPDKEPIQYQANLANTAIDAQHGTAPYHAVVSLSEAFAKPSQTCLFEIKPFDHSSAKQLQETGIGPSNWLNNIYIYTGYI